MTTPLDVLKAALEAKREAEREWEKYADVLVPSEESRHAALIVGRARNRMVGILTDDTIAALIAVAEAAHALAYYPDKPSVMPEWGMYDATCCSCGRYMDIVRPGKWQCYGGDAECDLVTALAPLVKEET